MRIVMRVLTALPCSSSTGVRRRRPAKPIVYVLSTGGTIAGSGSSSTDLSNYKPGAILGEQLVKAVPQIAQIADVRVEQIVNVRSSDLTIDNWLTLTKRIQAILKETPAVAGFVITSGTNTLEETAYFLHLTVRSDKPVVLVGSMRPATAISADGPLNLLNAVRTAIAPESTRQGRLDRVERRNQRRARHHQDQYAAGGNVSRARAGHPRLRRRGQGQLLPRHHQAAHRELGVRRHQPDLAAEGDDPVFLHRAGRDADPGGDQGRREGHRLRRHRQWHAVDFREQCGQGNSGACRRRLDRRWFDRAVSATAA